MRKLSVILLAVTMTAAITYSEILDNLKLTKHEAEECLLLSIGNGLLTRGNHTDLVSIARSLPKDLQVAGMRQLMQLARSYTQSDQFKNDYKKWRNKQINPDAKTKMGIPKLGKIIENKIDNTLDKTENEKKYPSNPDELVKKRLEDFLAISATVDFHAQLNGREFVNPEYRKKSPQWKMCYRAGEHVVQVAREEAQQWLNELNQ